MKNFQKICITLLLATGYLLSVTSSVDASKLYFERSDNVISKDSIFEIDLKLDPQKDEINAMEGSISFSDNLELQNINDGDSFLTLWIERPIVKDKNIIFSGITPGGYLGELSPYWDGYRSGNILTLTFKAMEVDSAWLKIGDTMVLLNDGEGTEIFPKIENEQFDIVATREQDDLSVSDSNDDSELPEDFNPQIIQDENIFDEKFFIIFETQDKGSGIFSYEIKEGREQFHKIESPYVLKDQDLESVIKIKAIDRSGNVRIVELDATYPPSFFKSYTFWIIIILIVIVIWRIRKRK